MAYSGKDIINLGVEKGPHIPSMIARANSLGRLSIKDLSDLLPAPKLPLREDGVYALLATATNQDEADNLTSVNATMVELMKTPVVKEGAVLPDCCPAGPLGTIPVGGVVSSTEIHPGMHSADICCSVMISFYPTMSPKEVMDKIASITHFGPGGSNNFQMPTELSNLVVSNRFTKPFFDTADYHFGTQGDGNHFAFVGTLESTGRTCLVTHHGSRGFGAKVYKEGMKVAEKYRQKLSPNTLQQNSWIPSDSQDGEDYWNALQVIREWTKQNHMVLHNAVGQTTIQFWNEHNFVFRKSDGLFYHAKGATPAFNGWADDSIGLTLIPMNMAEPVLITEGLGNYLSLGFSPHGAGRNFSRTQHGKRGLGDFEVETKGLDIRSFSGTPDLSELPSGYKNAKEVIKQIEDYKLARVVDRVMPYGSIMAGEQEQFWKKKGK